MNNIQKKTEEELSITVTIAERAYKLKISKEEEESVRKAAKRINGEIEGMDKLYKNKDKQDLLAMIALLNTNELIKAENNSRYDSKITAKLEEIDNLLIENLGI
jgi:cell division protein ZapA (FtsZ GTPase activity inhibitor)